MFADFASSAAPFVIEDSSSVASGFAYVYGVYLTSGFATVRNTTLKTQGSGLRYAAYVYSAAATIEVFNSRLLISGSGSSVTQSASSIARVAFSQLDGTTNGFVTCFQNFNSSFAAKSCP